MDARVQGDVNIACRQAPTNELIFRFGFHTAFIINTPVSMRGGPCGRVLRVAVPRRAVRRLPNAARRRALRSFAILLCVVLSLEGQTPGVLRLTLADLDFDKSTKKAMMARLTPEFMLDVQFREVRDGDVHAAPVLPSDAVTSVADASHTGASAGTGAGSDAPLGAEPAGDGVGTPVVSARCVVRGW
jgi:hypothetical protein